MIRAWTIRGVAHILFLAAACFVLAGGEAADAFSHSQTSGTTYYVSSVSGEDADNGLTPETAFRTIAKVNALNLMPGDRVLFICGETWRAEQLVIRRSGTEAATIIYGSYPEDCAERPVLTGSQPVGGWSLHAGSIYSADLNAGVNAGKFPMGVNQLFRDGERLTMGRWPNLDAPDGGYSTITGYPSTTVIADTALPAVNWTGAVTHIKNYRWSMVNRRITGSSGTSLTLGASLTCITSSCAGWGYFLNNHLATLDREGEWYYDKAARRVYLYSAGGAPADGEVEASVVLEEAETLRHGGIMLSDGSATAYVILENLDLRNWFNHGIGTPGGMSGEVYHHLTVRGVAIRDVNGAGVNLSSWLERPANGRKGLRGGHHLRFENLLIEGANQFGITGYFAESELTGIDIRDIGMIANLNESGMGCGYTYPECTEEGDGIRIRTYLPEDSGFGNTVSRNRLERIAYTGVDVFGHDNAIRENVITEACYAKGDCGGIRTFGSDSLAATKVYNLTLERNIIANIPGNTDGCHSTYRPPFGMGIYIDHYSRDVLTADNTIVNTTFTGLLYQNSTGEARGNTVYNASSGSMFAGQFSIGGSVSRVNAHDNIYFALKSNAWTIYSYDLANFLYADNNFVFHPYVNQHIAHGPSWTRYAFAAWKTFSGREANSRTNWYTQPAGEEPRSRIWYNDSESPLAVDLGGRKYLDLNQQPVSGIIILQPFASMILIDDGPVTLRIDWLVPAMWGADAAADFTLAVKGIGFTPGSIVRWNGEARPTTFADSTTLFAQIGAADVAVPGEAAVTVYDPSTVPQETAARIFRIYEHVYRDFLPLICR